MNDRARLVQTLVGVYGFYDKELTEFAIRIWSDAMEGFDLADVESAFDRHLKDSEAGRWLPKPADILRQLKGDVAEAALIAWGHVMTSARRGGGFGPEFCQAARQAVQALGGWSVICRSKEDDNSFLQRRFVEMFKAYQRRDESPPLIAGAEAIARIGRA